MPNHHPVIYAPVLNACNPKLGRATHGHRCHPSKCGNQEKGLEKRRPNWAYKSADGFYDRTEEKGLGPVVERVKL